MSYNKRPRIHPKQKAIMPKKNINLTPLVSEFAKEYKWHIESQNLCDYKPVSVGDGIKSGLCDLFAEKIKAKYPQSQNTLR
jgi:hypothetical protein